MLMKREDLQAKTDDDLNKIWLACHDALELMAFPTTAQVHADKLLGATADPYTEDEERTTMIESIVSMQAVISEHGGYER